MADQSGGGGGNNAMMRDYRKGNWNVNETMILIEAKKMDDERRTKRSEESGEGAGGGAGRGGGAKPSEPRWKWVEDYCWRRGCFRSQNQCNDKWDNLMRDYKKVREYERRRTGEEEEDEAASYWKIEKSERKERNLPTNMMPQIYEALVDVVERRAGGGGAQRAAAAASASVATYSIGHPNPDVIVSTGYAVETPIQPPLPPQQHALPGPIVPALPPSSQTPEAPPQLPSAAASQPLPTPESESSEHSDSPAKRRRRGGDRGAAASEDRHEPCDVGTAISRSASIIAEALQACDEREERRHRDLVGLHERRLKLEESKTEINRQGNDGLVSAINKLASSIHALASTSSSKNPPSS
ncbi:trihelix transcription factor GTL1-like [Syzygium oleosum]|uniref:trihelix transcription factor GTL1-like n=1 Tax=Syzygium oleosum TaxID=219896 RepID=UPI0011D2B196|nr:trihelix transcription factor GTL1-like [Syzygium oleosum]